MCIAQRDFERAMELIDQSKQLYTVSQGTYESASMLFVQVSSLCSKSWNIAHKTWSLPFCLLMAKYQFWKTAAGYFHVVKLIFYKSVIKVWKLCFTFRAAVHYFTSI